MPNTDGTCEYILDPDDPETWGGKEGDECYIDQFQSGPFLDENDKWSCPYNSEQGENLCIFHLPTKKKSEKEVKERLLDLINKRDGNIELIGSKFGPINIKNKQLEGEGCSLLLTHSQFQSNVNFSDSTFQGISLDFAGAVFKDEVNFSKVVFQTSPFQSSRMYGINFRGAEFRDRARFTGADLRCKFTFAGTIFEQGADFDRVTFTSHPSVQQHRSTTIGNIVFKTWADFSGSEFEEDINFNSINFGGEVNFDRIESADITFEDCSFDNWNHVRDSNISGNFKFINTSSDGRLEFEDTIIEGHLEINKCNNNTIKFKNSKIGGDFNVDDTTVEGESTFESSYCNGTIIIQNSEFQSRTDFSHLSFSGGIITDSTLIIPNFKKSDLTDIDLSGSSIRGGNLERAQMSRADLFGTTLKGTAFYGAVIGDSQINEDTEFGGRCVYDSEFNGEWTADVGDNETGQMTKAAGQYRIIEKLARENAFPDMVSHNFIRRQDIHREQHRQEGRWGRWLRATASKYVLEYGENPWRLIATGLIIVGTFGLLYPLVGGLQPTGGSPITASRVIENPLLLAQSIYYSTLTFTTLGMGDFLPVGLGRVLTTLETSLGAIIIALLVFVFGRRAAR